MHLWMNISVNIIFNTYVYKSWILNKNETVINRKAEKKERGREDKKAGESEWEKEREEMRKGGKGRKIN